MVIFLFHFLKEVCINIFLLKYIKFLLIVIFLSIMYKIYCISYIFGRILFYECRNIYFYSFSFINTVLKLN